MRKAERELRRMAKRYGFKPAGATKGNHLLLVHRTSGYRVVVASTPSDHRSLKNCEALLKRKARELAA